MTPVAEFVQRLCTILEEEERLYIEMRDLLQEEREVIVRRNAGDLESLVRRKDGLAREGKLLEDCRRNVMRELAQEIGLSESEATLSRICTLMGEEGSALRSIHGRLIALIAAVRELLEANANFAGEALGRVQSTLRLLGRLLPDEPTYGRRPATRNAQPHMVPGRILRQAV